MFLGLSLCNTTTSKGVELFGDKVNVAVQKELREFHDLETYKPILESDILLKDKKDALESLLFIVEKRNSNIKARKVADSSKQRTYAVYNKVDGSSRKIITKGIFMTGVMDTRKGRTTAMLDVSNAFLHADNDKRVRILFCGKLAKL